MSGAMIKTGLYGLVRSLDWLAPAPASWGVALVALGIASAVVGIATALGQRDLKRLLAYSSVENVGLVALGLGLGALALASGAPSLAALAFAGALLHVWSHAAMKGLLFLAAGSVAHGAGTLDLERLGGLARRMPSTTIAFLLGAASICALPPTAGFASELLLLLAAFGGVASRAVPVLPLLAAIAGLALVAGLAAACFVRAAGIGLLGEPRSEEAAKAAEAPRGMLAPMAALAAGCLLLGVASALVVRGAAAPVARLIGDPIAATVAFAEVEAVLARTSAVGVGVLALVAGLVLGRRRALAARAVATGPTWDCGYAAPTARMQYTASSFAQPLTALLARVAPTRDVERAPEGWFPAAASFHTRTGDLARLAVFEPIFRGVGALGARVHALRSGSTHAYVLYVLLAALALFAWRLG
jgi:formate hydrogenlyase subunit 3/multisubunit Na+/H+ antiporter MnhD subunit